MPIVQKVLSGMTDAQGDKFVTLAAIEGNPLFITAGPVKANDEVIGAVLISSYTRDLLRFLAQSTFSEVSLFNLEGNLVDTTLPINQDNGPTTLAIGSEADRMLTVDGQASLKRSIAVGGREYAVLYGVGRARGEPLGFYGVAFPTQFITSYSTTARNQMFLIFAIALMLVFGIGYLTANVITGQLQHLMESALAVAGGDFSRRPRITSTDEIGSLAQSLDHMTENLASYTRALQDRIDELEFLYESSTSVTVRSRLNLNHVLQAAIASTKEILGGTGQVIIFLLDENDQLLRPRACALGATTDYPLLDVSTNGAVNAALAQTTPQVMALSDLELDAREGSFTVEGISSGFIAPLVAGQETVGALVLIPYTEVPEARLLNDDTKRLLGTLANQAAIAIKNAQLFEATQQAYQELRQLDSLKTQFINIAAHELRTPLGAMLGYASFVEKRVPSKLQKSMRFLTASMLRMRTMVDAMLAIQRLDAGTAFVRLAPVDVREIVTKVVNDYQPMAELEGHTIQAKFSETLPLVQADTEKLDLILSNLLSNAVKFTPEGGCIVVSAQDYIKGILIGVQDNGPGIAPEDQARIFERFYQSHQDQLAGHGGMGIGLTIVRHLVELHEGQVWVESEPHQGTTIYFTLPHIDLVDPNGTSSGTAEIRRSRNSEELLEVT
jgi:signal transduction histidine kinase/HAMP domain-containing protein